jgi:pimeloyl-ACP methyl ester carboxylesterase
MSPAGAQLQAPEWVRARLASEVAASPFRMERSLLQRWPHRVTLTTHSTEAARSHSGADGQTLAWFVHGPPATASSPPISTAPAHPVLLVHGLASNASRFEEFAQATALTQRHRVIRVDLRGHGRAITRRPVGLSMWCDDLKAVLQAEGGQPAVLVGHSMGAQVVLRMALQHPSWVKALVLIDPVFRHALNGRSRRIARAAPLWAAMAAVVRALNALGIQRGKLPPLDLRALDRAARLALASPEAEAAFIAQYSSTRADLRHLPLCVYLEDLVAMCHSAPLPRDLPMPVLALMSTGATFADARAMRQALAGPRVQVQDIDCHHWPLTERPVEVREAIERWMAAQQL